MSRHGRDIARFTHFWAVYGTQRPERETNSPRRQRRAPRPPELERRVSQPKGAKDSNDGMDRKNCVKKTVTVVDLLYLVFQVDALFRAACSSRDVSVVERSSRPRAAL